MITRPGIAVAVDGSAASSAAVRWAASEAARRRVALTVVHVCEVNSAYLWALPHLPEQLQELSRPTVVEAMALARRTAPEVEVGDWTLVGPASRMLLLVSEQAGLLVLGRSGKTALAANLVGSVTYRMAAHAHCPVVTIPDQPSEQDGQPEPKRIVVGLADRPTAGHALDFAVAEAARHGAELLVVRAWHRTDADPVFREAEELERLNQLAAAHLSHHSARISSASMVRAGSPASVLAGLCQPDDLLVLGQHRHAPFVPASVGTVIADCLHRAPCPVAVVPEPAVSEAHQERPRVAEAAGLITY
jgi:nucleotide-binding universal stress UspA family protein